jgi:succinoglycan biosynthesis protein ExoM
LISGKPHISVCIATHKRPELLKYLLQSLNNQKTGGVFGYSLVVVDNDAGGSAKAVVAGFKKASLIKVEYHIQPVKNISLTRNMCVGKSRGDYIAFIDDDEYACGEWLYELYSTLTKYRADVVHGYVEAEFLRPVTSFRRKLFCFTHYHTLGKPDVRQGQRNYIIKATNNCLIKSSIIKKYEQPFDLTYGLTGGSDTEFFMRVAGTGACFCWAANAVVYERVSLKRCRLSNIIKRILRTGNVFIRIRTGHCSMNKKQLIYLLLFCKFLCWMFCFPVLMFVVILNIKYFLYFTHNLIFYLGMLSNIYLWKIYEYK